VHLGQLGMHALFCIFDSCEPRALDKLCLARRRLRIQVMMWRDDRQKPGHRSSTVNAIQAQVEYDPEGYDDEDMEPEEIEIYVQTFDGLEDLMVNRYAAMYGELRAKLGLPANLRFFVEFADETVDNDGSCFDDYGMDDGARLNVHYPPAAEELCKKYRLKHIEEPPSMVGARFCNNKRGASGVLFFLQQNDYNRVEEFLEAGADANCRDSSWNSPLYQAVSGKPLDYVTLLLRYGARPDNVSYSKHSRGETSLHKALQKARTHTGLSVAQELVSHGARVDIQDLKESKDYPASWTPLHHVVSLNSHMEPSPSNKSQYRELLEAMLRAAALHDLSQMSLEQRTIDIQDCYGHTPLHLAAMQCREESTVIQPSRLISKLKRAGANIHIRNSRGNTAENIETNGDIYRC